MNDRAFSNGGAMFPRDKKSENAPDFGGDFTIDGELLQHVIDKIKAGEQVKIEVSGWKRTDKKGKGFLSLKVRKPWVREAIPIIAPDPFGGAVGTGPITSKIKAPSYADKTVGVSNSTIGQANNGPAFFDEGGHQEADPWA